MKHKKIIKYIIFTLILSLSLIPKPKALENSQYTYSYSGTCASNINVQQIGDSSGYKFAISNPTTGVSKLLDFTSATTRGMYTQNGTNRYFNLYNVRDIIATSSSYGGQCQTTTTIRFYLTFNTLTTENSQYITSYNYNDYFSDSKLFLSSDNYNNTAVKNSRYINTSVKLKDINSKPNVPNALSYNAYFDYNFDTSGVSTIVNTVHANATYYWVYDYMNSSGTGYYDSTVGIYSKPLTTHQIIYNDLTQSKIYYSNKNIYNSDSYNTYRPNDNIYYTNNWVSPLPSYLNGYKEVVLDSNTKYVFLSGQKSGKIYIPKNEYNSYGGKVTYWDIDKDSMPYSATILDINETSDNKYIYQDFDIANYEGADLILFNKYLYLENINYDKFSYSIYVPENMHVSKTKPVANADGGNDYDFNYIDENGNVIDKTISSKDVDLSDIQKYMNQIKDNLTNNSLIAYFKNFWDEIRKSKIGTYMIIAIIGSMIILIFKVIKK